MEQTDGPLLDLPWMRSWGILSNGLKAGDISPGVRQQDNIVPKAPLRLRTKLLIETIKKPSNRELGKSIKELYLDILCNH